VAADALAVVDDEAVAHGRAVRAEAAVAAGATTRVETTAAAAVVEIATAVPGFEGAVEPHERVDAMGG
jgi:hypothetical protein